MDYKSTFNQMTNCSIENTQKSHIVEQLCLRCYQKGGVFNILTRYDSCEYDFLMRILSWDLLWDKITPVRILIESVMNQLVIRYLHNLNINLVGKLHDFFVGIFMFIFIFIVFLFISPLFRS